MSDEHQPCFPLTIVTICRNRKDDIAITCESIVNQTWQDFEWVVIDGASTDGTVEILEKYRHRMNVFVSEKDRNISEGLNKGLAKAQGEYILILNGGDRFVSLSTLKEAFADVSHDADILYGDVYRERNGTIFGIHSPAPESEVNRLFFAADTLEVLGAFIKRELYQKYGYFEEKYPYSSDWEKFIVFANNGATFKKINTVVSVFTAGGATDRNSPTYPEVQTELKRMIASHYTDEEIAESKRRRFMRVGYSVTKPIIPLFGGLNLLYTRESPDGIKKRYCFLGIPLLKVRRKTVETAADEYFLFGFIKFPKF